MLNYFRQWVARLTARHMVQKDRNEVAILEEWSNVPMGCCDCGLIHRFDFWVNNRGQLCVRARRDVQMTAAIRTVQRFPRGHAYPGVPVADVHPVHVRAASDPRDRGMRFTDRRAADLIQKAVHETRGNGKDGAA